MTQCRLNNIHLVHCHNEMTDAIDLTAIAQDFIAAISCNEVLGYSGQINCISHLIVTME